MRETQMKKIIAAAVAAAFVAPVYAADISVSGEIEMTYVSNTGSQDAMSTADNNIVVTASEEVGGISVTGAVQMDQDTAFDGTGGDQTGTLSLGLPGGLTVNLGDVAGAMDSVGDYTDMAPAYGGFGADGSDHSATVSLAVGPATVYASMSPQGGALDGADSDETAFAVKVPFAGGEAYFATEEDSTAKWQTYGLKYAAAGFTVAFEKGSDDNGSNADDKYTGLAFNYKMGDIVVGAESQEVKTDGNAASTDDVITFVEYNLGSSIDLYVSQRSSSGSGSNVDGTTVGIEYVF
jgi:hypothetical protein